MKRKSAILIVLLATLALVFAAGCNNDPSGDIDDSSGGDIGTGESGTENIGNGEEKIEDPPSIANLLPGTAWLYTSGANASLSEGESIIEKLELTFDETENDVAMSGWWGYQPGSDSETMTILSGPAITYAVEGDTVTLSLTDTKNNKSSMKLKLDSASYSNGTIATSSELSVTSIEGNCILSFEISEGLAFDVDFFDATYGKLTAGSTFECTDAGSSG